MRRFDLLASLRPQATTVLQGIADDLSSLSHRLHSSVLDNLGLVPSINSLCAEFGRQHGIQVEFGHRNIPPTVLPEPALNIFRIVQEGLHNVSKHSRACPNVDAGAKEEMTRFPAFNRFPPHLGCASNIQCQRGVTGVFPGVVGFMSKCLSLVPQRNGVHLGPAMRWDITRSPASWHA